MGTNNGTAYKSTEKTLPKREYMCASFRCEARAILQTSIVDAAIEYASIHNETDDDGKDVHLGVGAYRDIAVVTETCQLHVVRVKFGWGAVCDKTHVGDTVTCQHCELSFRVK